MQIRRLAPVALAGALLLTPTLAACGGSTEAAPGNSHSGSGAPGLAAFSRGCAVKYERMWPYMSWKVSGFRAPEFTW